MKKNKYITFIILTLLITTMVFGFAVSNVLGAVPYVTGFEAPEGVLEQNYDNGHIVTFHNDPANFGVSNIQKYSGTKSFYTSDADHSGWINISYDSDKVLQSLEFWIYVDDGVFNLYGYETEADVATDNYKIWVKPAGASWQYEDINGADNAFASTEFDVWHYMKIEFTAIDEVVYEYNNQSEIGTPATLLTGEGIRYLRIINNANTDDIFLDELLYSIGDSYGSGVGGGDDYSNYLQECNLEGMTDGTVLLQSSSPNFQGNIIETKHYVKYNKDIIAIDFYFNEKQQNYVPDLDNYILHLRGTDISTGINPTEWIFVDSTTDKLRFDNIDYSMKDIYGTDYKEFLAELIITDTTHNTYLKVSPEDIQWKHSKAHGDSFYWANDQFDGDYIGGGIGLSHSMCIIFDEVQVTYDCEYPEDKLFVSPTTGYTGQTINVNYQLTTKFTDTYLNITKDGESLTNQPFSLPALLDECTSNKYSFNAWSTGTYNISLWRYGTAGSLDYKTVTVLENPDKDTYVTSYPNPSDLYADYTVLVNYTHPSGYDGALFVSFGEPSIEGLTPYTTFPSGTINSTFKQNKIYMGTYYYILAFAKDGAYGIMNTVLPESAIHPHIVEGLTSFDDWITVEGDIVFDEGTVGTQHFTCSHGYIGQNVVVRDNGFKIMDVPNGFYQHIEYTVSKTGNHQVELVLIDCCGGDDEVLATDNYTAAHTGVGGGATSPILPELDEKVGALIGIILTIVLTLLPILIQVGFKVDIEVPALVYGAFGCFGIILSIYLGFFDIWVIVFIIAVLLLFAVIQFFQNK